jgi:RNA polymerase sigma factor for flagellar operon FliA
MHSTKTRRTKSDSTTPNGDMQALLGLVRRMARRMIRRLPASVQLDDLVSAGHEGLAHAISVYDPALGVPFSTFVRNRIGWAMLNHLRGQDTMPRAKRRLSRTLARSEQELIARLGREPTEAEKAAELGISVELYRRWASQCAEHQIVSLEGDDDRYCAYEPKDPGPDPECQYIEADLRQHMWSVVETLPERQRQVLHMYYGQGMKLRQVASELGVTVSRACQVRSAAQQQLTLAMQQPVAKA